MARLVESPLQLERIRLKALHNSVSLATYGTKAEFKPGRTIMDFESQCESIKRLKLRYID